jgi:hypothetical protein
MMRELWRRDRQKQATNVFGAGNRHDLVKRPPAVVFADGISLLIADMVVRRNQDADRVCLCQTVSGASSYEAWVVGAYQGIRACWQVMNRPYDVSMCEPPSSAELSERQDARCQVLSGS